MHLSNPSSAAYATSCSTRPCTDRLHTRACSKRGEPTPTPPGPTRASAGRVPQPTPQHGGPLRCAPLTAPRSGPPPSPPRRHRPPPDSSSAWIRFGDKVTAKALRFSRLRTDQPHFTSIMRAAGVHHITCGSHRTSWSRRARGPGEWNPLFGPRPPTHQYFKAASTAPLACHSANSSVPR